MQANAEPPTKISGNVTGTIPLHESAPLAVLLFVFWVILSGKIDFFHLAAGAVSSLAIAAATCRLYALSPPVGPAGRHPFWTFPWIRLAAYAPWLARQIVVSSFQVARIVLSPKMKIRPSVVKFDYPLPHNIARATLANSITLTPGTVTIDVRGDEYVVHALTDDAAEPLLSADPSLSNMKERVRTLFRIDET